MPGLPKVFVGTEKNNERGNSMKINVKTLKLNLNDATLEKLENKLAKFDRLMGDEAVADVTFKTQKDRVFLEIAIYSGDMIIRAESDDEDAKTAIDKIIGVIEGQFRKYKTKIEKRNKNVDYSKFVVDSVYDVEEEKEFNVVKSKKFSVKPMSVDEAILQMNLLNHEFFVFTNAETNDVNIVYKRKDKNYGLIEID